MNKSKDVRPYVICHMVSSIDGKIQPNLWPKNSSVHSLYEKIHRRLKGDAWIIGRKSMEGFSSKRIHSLPTADKSIQKNADYIADKNAKKFAVVIDPNGKCRWEKNDITGDHVIEVLTEKVSLAYLTHLRQKKISYLFAGKTEIDPARALFKLREKFGIKRLLLEGGGIINGAFLKADLIDEVSQLIMPFADGSMETPTLFDVEKGYTRRKGVALKFKKSSNLADGIVWLQYSVIRK